MKYTNYTILYHFPGNDIGSAGELCGSLCIDTNGCSHFSHFEGVCYLKNTPSGTPRVQKSGVVCGYLPSGIHCVNLFLLFPHKPKCCNFDNNML